MAGPSCIVGASERKQRELQERKTLLLNISRELFLEKGFAAVSVQEICRQAEYGKSAFYGLFESKEEVFSHIKLQGFTRIATEMQKRTEGATPAMALEQSALLLCDFLANEPRLYEFCFLFYAESFHTPPHMEKEIQALVEEALQPVQKALHDLGDREGLGELFYTGLLGVINHFPRHGIVDEPTIRESALQFVSHFIKGLG